MSVNRAAASAVVHKAGLLSPIVTYYEAHKTAFGNWVGVDDWLLHTHVGMAIFLAVVIVFRRTLTSPWPFVVVMVCEGINEYFDSLAYHSWRVPDTMRDIVFTLLWPLLIFVLAKTRAIRPS
ncbi:MAG: hypothetical protein ACKVOJ_00560 [Sphingomonadaceae bacterium]